MNKRLIYCLTLLFLISCENKNEAIVKDIDTLIEDEKFSLAQDKIKSKLEGKRTSDEVLSNKKPINPRIIEVSNDRNRVVWTEDKQITFRDLANPLSKSLTFPDVHLIFLIRMYLVKIDRLCRLTVRVYTIL